MEYTGQDKMSLLEAQEVKDSTYLGHIKKELDYRMNLKLQELRRCKTQQELDKVSAAIDTFEEAKNIPDDVIEREES